MSKLNWKSIVGWGIAALVVAAIIGTNMYQDKKAVEGKFVVALNLPLSGLMSAYGVPYANGLKMGIQDEFSENHVPFDSYVVDIGDNQSKASDAVTLLQRQQLNGFDVYVSGLSDASRAVANILDKTKIPHFIVAFDRDAIVDGTGRMRILPNSNLEIPAFVQFLKNKNPKKVFIISYNNKSVQTLVYQGIKPYLDEKGIDYQIEKLDTNFNDFRILALKVKEYNPDVILIQHYDFGLIKTIPTLKEQALIHNGNTYIGLDMVELVNTQTDYSITKDIIFNTTYFNINPNQDFVQRYKEQFGKEPTYFAAYGYDAGRLIAKTWIKDGKISKESIIGQTPYNGVSGTVKLSKNGDLESDLFSGIVDQNNRIHEWENITD